MRWEGWIPVEARLPEPGKRVLVFDGEVQSGEYDARGSEYEGRLIFWRSRRNGPVTHWQLLPEPPRQTEG